VAAALTQRPELFRAVSCGAPLTDMLRYHKLTIGQVWAGEFGTADDPEQFKYLLAYSPYHNVRSGMRYPAVLITTGDSDTRVAPGHALKMAALLQAATASDPDERPILLHVQEKTGHGGGRPLDMSLELMADDLTWLMWQLGMIEPPKRSRAAADNR
jgi:prolyl oligopeptidase